MDKENKSKIFCSECGKEKEKNLRFCNNCKKETSNLYTVAISLNGESKVSVSGGIKRGDISWAYFPIAYGILLILSVGIIQLFEIISWYFRIILIIVVSLIFFYLCFFNGRFRNFIVKIFTSSKEFIERF
jgi:nitrate reductase NapE component